MTPVLTQDGRYLPEVTISEKDCRARPSTYSPAVFTNDERRAQPSLPTLPGTDGTIGRQGPGVRTGRLGILVTAGRSPSYRTPLGTVWECGADEASPPTLFLRQLAPRFTSTRQIDLIPLKSPLRSHRHRH